MSISLKQGETISSLLKLNGTVISFGLNGRNLRKVLDRNRGLFGEVCLGHNLADYRSVHFFPKRLAQNNFLRIYREWGKKEIATEPSDS